MTDQVLKQIIIKELKLAIIEEKEKKKKSAKDRMKCNSSRRIRKGEPGHGKKKFVVKACDGGTEKTNAKERQKRLVEVFTISC